MYIQADIRDNGSRQVLGKLMCVQITTVTVADLLLIGFQYDRKGGKVSIWGQALVKMRTYPFVSDICRSRSSSLSPDPNMPRLPAAQ